MMPASSARIFVAGHRGMVGSAIVRLLRTAEPTAIIITAERDQLDLRNQGDTARFFADNKIDHVYLAAAKVGGIMANSTRAAEFLYDNLVIETNVIHSSFVTGVKRLLFLGSSCIYPKLSPQPILEEALLTGPLEPTNEAYAIAKISGILLCKSYNEQYGCDYRAVMPTNLYGPNDNFDPYNSHVIPGLMAKLCEARRTKKRSLTLWGTGSPLREFLHVDDLASACLFVMGLSRLEYSQNTSHPYRHVNVGSGSEISIKDLAILLSRVIGFEGTILWDSAKPDGTPRKLMNSNRLISMGWRPNIPLTEGLEATFKWYVENRLPKSSSLFF
jgi:GDP-L-fucose synthase